MSDIFSKAKRSDIMSKILGKETKPEILVRKFLFSNGFRYRKNLKKLPGTPDIVLLKYKTAIFVNGCFWHGHKNCKRFALPATNINFWQNKINGNIKRDKAKKLLLKKMGYKVITIWQCQLNSNNRKKTLNRLIKMIEKQ